MMKVPLDWKGDTKPVRPPRKLQPQGQNLAYAQGHQNENAVDLTQTTIKMLSTMKLGTLKLQTGI